MLFLFGGLSSSSWCLKQTVLFYCGTPWTFHINEPRHEKSNFFHMRKQKTQISFAVAAKLISAFVFATYIVQSLFFLNPKFQASSHLLELYSLVCVGPGRKPECWFSHDAAHLPFFYLVSVVMQAGLCLINLVRSPKDRFSHNNSFRR